MPNDRKYRAPCAAAPAMAGALPGQIQGEEEAPRGLRDPGAGDIERFPRAE